PDVESSLYYVRERPYFPSLARWSALDPQLIAQWRRFRNLAAYGYVRNRPTRFFDPAGAGEFERGGCPGSIVTYGAADILWCEGVIIAVGLYWDVTRKTCASAMLGNFYFTD